jgi:peptidyl-prolyl cis-trans isomerase C
MEQNRVIAYVDNRPVTEMDIEFLLHTIGHERAGQFQSEEGRQQLLDELINQELFYSDAIENGLHETASFMRELERMTVNLVKQYAIRAFLDQVELSDEEVLAVYNENPNQFATKDQIRAAHILVSTEDEAQQIKKELSEGLSFEEAAQKYSSCPSKSKGGDLSYFSKGQMVPEFEMACFAGQIGDVTEPVATQFGYHIIHILDKKEATTMNFEEVKEPLRQQALVQKQNRLFYDQVKKLRQKYEIKIND